MPDFQDDIVLRPDQLVIAEIKENAGGGQISLKDSSGDLAIQLSGAQGWVRSWKSGFFCVDETSGTSLANLTQSNGAGQMTLYRAPDSDRVAHLDGGGNAWLGGNGQDGDLIVFDKSGDNQSLAESTIHLEGKRGICRLGGYGANGSVWLRSGDGVERIRLEASGAQAWLGGNGADGDLLLFDSSGDNKTLEQATIHLDGQRATSHLGGNGADGDLRLYGREVNERSVQKATIHLEGSRGIGRLGGDGADGSVWLRSGDGEDKIRLEASEAQAWLGGNGADGDLLLFDSSGDNKTLDQATIHLDGESGDVTLTGALHIKNWTIEAPDYVFGRDYPLPSLEEVAAHIEQHRHLEGVPSAAQLNAEGLDVASFSMTLLEKLEELTLYLLQQQDQIEALKTRIQALEGGDEA